MIHGLRLRKNCKTMSSKITVRYNFIGDKKGCTILHGIFQLSFSLSSECLHVSVWSIFSKQNCVACGSLLRIENYNFCSTVCDSYFFFNEISGMVRVTREQRDLDNLRRLPEKKGWRPRFFGFTISEVRVIPHYILRNTRDFIQSTLLISRNCFLFRSFLRKNVKIMLLVLQIWRLVATWFFIPGKLVNLALLLIPLL